MSVGGELEALSTAREISERLLHEEGNCMLQRNVTKKTRTT